MLKIKNYKEILGKMIVYTVTTTSKLTDFSEGSAIRTLYNAFALQLEEFYFSMSHNIKYMIETSLYEAFGFTLLPATRAVGYVELTLTSPTGMTVAKGTEFTCKKPKYRGLVYHSLEEVEIPAGELKYYIRVECKEEGSKGNLPPNELNIKSISDTRIVKVTNPKAISGGSDKETYEQRVSRFRKYISTLSKATKDSLLYAVLTTPGVAGAYLSDEKPGLVKIYCHDSNGELSTDLKSQIEFAVEKVRAAGVEVLILPVDKKSVSIKATIIVPRGKDIPSIESLVELYLDNWIKNLPVGYSLTLAELYQVIMNSYDDIITNCYIESPDSDITGLTNTVFMPDTIEVKAKYE